MAQVEFLSIVFILLQVSSAFVIKDPPASAVPAEALIAKDYGDNFQDVDEGDSSSGISNFTIDIVRDTSNRIKDINANPLKSKIFDKLLQDYDKNIRPVGLNGSGPVEIEVNIFIRSIENIDDKNMEYKMQLSFRQEWVDQRLRYGDKYGNIDFLQLVVSEKVWMPDLFFANEKSGLLHELIIPNRFTRIYQDGRVTQSYRISLLLTCQMNLHKYPMDEQSCPLRIASYGYTIQDIMLRWRHTEPVQLAREFSMARFKLQKHNTVLCESKTASGIFGCLSLDLTFDREFGFYMIQIYVPCSMLVIVSWVSFWLEPTAVEARVSLGVTTILTIVTQTYGINQSVPPASYIKALDVWTATCQAMIFGAILQFSFVNYTASYRWKKREYGFQLEENAAMKKLAYCKAKRIDKLSRIIFPMTFLLFNITYWTGYLLTDFENISFEEAVSVLSFD